MPRRPSSTTAWEKAGGSAYPRPLRLNVS
jgi:hypothetical protein